MLVTPDLALFQRGSPHCSISVWQRTSSFLAVSTAAFNKKTLFSIVFSIPTSPAVAILRFCRRYGGCNVSLQRFCFHLGVRWKCCRDCTSHGVWLNGRVVQGARFMFESLRRRGFEPHFNQFLRLFVLHSLVHFGKSPHPRTPL